MTASLTLTTTTETLPVLAWQTKTGKERAAFSPSAQSRAPSAARHALADQQTLAQLKNGQYRPFLRDVHAKLSKGHMLALGAAMRAALARTVDGIPMVPDTDAALAACNKSAALAVCAFLLSPRAIVKGVEAPKDLPKSAAWLREVAAAWMDSMTEAAPQ